MKTATSVWVSALIAASATVVGQVAMADGGRSAVSKTSMSAAEEVQDPAVESDGRAVAVIAFHRNFRKATIRLNYTNLVGEFTRLHLHCNAAGANGPIAVGIVDLVALALDNGESNRLDSHSVTGSIRNSQFLDTDPCAGAVGRSITDLRSLAAAIDDGLIYWNLHTTTFPAGELRGQAAPLTRLRENDD